MTNVVMRAKVFRPNPEARAGKRCNPRQKLSRSESSKNSYSGDASAAISKVTPVATTSVIKENTKWNFDLGDI